MLVIFNYSEHEIVSHVCYIIYILYGFNVSINFSEFWTSFIAFCLLLISLTVWIWSWFTFISCWMKPCEMKIVWNIFNLWIPWNVLNNVWSWINFKQFQRASKSCSFWSLLKVVWYWFYNEQNNQFQNVSKHIKGFKTRQHMKRHETRLKRYYFHKIWRNIKLFQSCFIQFHMKWFKHIKLKQFHLNHMRTVEIKQTKSENTWKWLKKCVL